VATSNGIQFGNNEPPAQPEDTWHPTTPPAPTEDANAPTAEEDYVPPNDHPTQNTEGPPAPSPPLHQWREPPRLGAMVRAATWSSQVSRQHRAAPHLDAAVPDRRPMPPELAHSSLMSPQTRRTLEEAHARRLAAEVSLTRLAEAREARGEWQGARGRSRLGARSPSQTGGIVSRAPRPEALSHAP